MSKIKELINIHLRNNISYRNAQNLAAEEIIIKKIAASGLSEHVTLKGGIVMYNLTKSDRRVTQDIDFDLIRYSIDSESINLFVEKMNRINDGLEVSITGTPEDLHQEDYRGVRVKLLINDGVEKLKIKLDIGVHTYSAIEQNRIAFDFERNGKSISMKVNPPEQIVAEKLISLARLGVISTRYKDLYDLYYLIQICGVSNKKVSTILNMFFANSNKKPNNIVDFQNIIGDTLESENFGKEASNPISKWIDVDYPTIKDTIINFINNL